MSVHRARQLRHRATEAEKALWRALRSRQLAGIKFRRQFPIGRYVVDFVALEAHLIIEVDGGQHAGESPERSRHLEALGFHVIRFWNNDVLSNRDGVLAEIASILGRR